ncbi:MAG: cytoskeleton protein RodZ [Arenicella sp.]
MDDKKKLEDEVQVAPKQGSGSLLAAARKQQNKNVEEIAGALNLSATQIRTIELDQSEGLPEPTYVRGYIRSYARLLGLNEDEVLDHYLNPNWQKGSRLDEMPRGIGSANDSDSRGFFTAGKVVVIVVLGLIIGFLWFTGQLGGIRGSQTASITTPESVSTVRAPQAEDDQVPDDLSSVELTQESDDEIVAEPVSVENQLSLSFTDTSWVDIRDGDGNRLAYKSYAQGEDLSVSATTPMSVFIGNAKAVSAVFNGVAYDISPFREGVFARFTVGE